MGNAETFLLLHVSDFYPWDLEFGTKVYSLLVISVITGPRAATLVWHRCAAPSLAWKSQCSYDISVCVLILSSAVFMDGI